LRIFISYSYKDSEFAALLKKVLLKNSIEVIQIDQEPKIGDNIAANIDNAIRESDAYIIILSKSYIDSKWSDLELMMIYDQSFGRKNGKRIFPILLEKTSKIPSLIRDLAYADLTDRHNRIEDIENFVIKLINQLNSEETTDYRTLRNLLREKQELLKIQELDYQLQKNKQLRIRKVFQWSFLMVLVMSILTSLLFLTKGFDVKNTLDDYKVEFQSVIFYFLGFLTAIIPSLYIAIKYKNKQNGR
jgi:hypothetical protein